MTQKNAVCECEREEQRWWWWFNFLKMLLDIIFFWWMSEEETAMNFILRSSRQPVNFFVRRTKSQIQS